MASFSDIRSVGITVLLILLNFFSIGSGGLVAALNGDETKSIYNDTVWYVGVGNLTGTSCSADNGTVTDGSIVLLMQAIAMHESGGSPTAQNNKNDPKSASGRYQMIYDTWHALANKYYPPANQYFKAADAPAEVQDAVVYLTFADYSIKQYNAFQIAVIWYGGTGVLNDIANKFNTVPGGGNSQPFGDFGNEMVDFMKAVKDLNPIAIKYHDTPRYQGKALSDISIDPQSAVEFGTQLNKLGGTPKPLKIVNYASNGQPIDSTSTTVSGSSGTENCNGGIPAGDFVFYNQNDSKWASHPFGSSTIGVSGCGPTSVAMVVATLADKSITPIETADFGTQNGGYIPGVGSNHQKMLVEGPEHWGLSVQRIGTNLDQAAQIIRSGGLVIASGAGASPFSSGGHIVVLRAIDSNGNFLIGNPAPGLQQDRDQSFSASALLAAGLTNAFGITK